MSRVDSRGTSPADPLGFMKRLSPSVTYYEPSTSSIASGDSNANRDPELILLSTWMGARESHIAKYVQQYRLIFPTSRIIVAQCPFTHVVMPWLAWTQIRPAVPILKEVVESGPKKLLDDDASSISGRSSAPPRVLIHAFSNGGISTTIFLYNALKRALGGKLALPRHIFIFDSCPGTFRWRNTARAIMQVLPRWMSPAVHTLLFSVWLFYRVTPMLQPRQNINSRTIRNPRFLEFEARRTYLYGTADEMIPPSDVEREADLAAQAGFSVRLERFDHAAHVAIPMSHPDRYWRVVRESWYGEQMAQLTGIVVEGADATHAVLEVNNGPEAVSNRISIVGNEKLIHEEASILARGIKSDADATIEGLQKTVQHVAENAQPPIEAVATRIEDAKKALKVAPDEVLVKAEDAKVDTHAAIEHGEAQMQQIKGSAKGMLKEIEIKGKGKSLSKEADTAAFTAKDDAPAAVDEIENLVKKAVVDVKSAASVPKTAEEDTEVSGRKTSSSERPKTPDTSTALQAALVAAKSSPEATKSGAAKAEEGKAEQQSVVQKLEKPQAQAKTEKAKSKKSKKKSHR